MFIYLQYFIQVYIGVKILEYFIRKAKKQDLKQIQQVAKTSWNDTYENIIPLDIQEEFLQSAYSDEMMVRRLEKTVLLVAEHMNKIVGFANFSPLEDNTAELAAIYLKPAYKRKGIGAALLQTGIHLLEDVKSITLHVEKENEIGMNFYQSKGFSKVDEFEEDLNGYTLKTVKMTLHLSISSL